MTWDEVKELAPLYVIGALDEKSASDLEASLHKATPEQQRIVARWRDVAALLPHALPTQTPADDLRERVLKRIAEEAGRPPIEVAAGGADVTEIVEQKAPIEIAVEASALEEAAENKVLPFVQPRRIESKNARWLLIAATALLALASAYLFTQNARLTRERDNLARERDSLSEELAAWRRQVDEIVSPKTRIIAMVGDEAPQANAKIVWDTKTQQWVIYIFDLPALPPNKDYQLWYVTKNAKISAAVFRPNEEGRAVLKLTLPPDALAGLAATAVTLEPRGGSPQPTGKFYLKASI